MSLSSEYMSHTLCNVASRTLSFYVSNGLLVVLVPQTSEILSRLFMADIVGGCSLQLCSGSI